MLLLADLLLLEESLFKGPRLAAAVARRFILFAHNYILLLLKHKTNIDNFEKSEIGGCCNSGAGSKLILKFCLQLIVWLQDQLGFKFAA